MNSAWAMGEEGETRAGVEANRVRASSCEGAYGDKERTLAVLKSLRWLEGTERYGLLGERPGERLWTVDAVDGPALKGEGSLGSVDGPPRRTSTC